MPDRAYALAGSAAKGGSAAAAATLILCLCLFGGVAHAQGHMSQTKGMDLHQARSPTEKKLFEDIRCRCGTCTDVLSSCNCGSAPGYRAEIQKQLDAGQTPDQVIQYIVSHYGEEWLVVPLDKGFNRLAWVLPMGVLFGAAGLLTVFARRWTRRGVDTRRAVAAVGVDAPTATEKDDYEARLDDELDDLD
jgi:cytochrome c-type biogenesis protein CcmH/NrfF